MGRSLGKLSIQFPDELQQTLVQTGMAMAAKY